MLILLIRIFFVLFATTVGYADGHYFFGEIFDKALPPWFAASLGFGISITLIAAEQAFRRRFTRSLVAFLIGLGVGLTLTGLLIGVMHLVLQNRDLANNLDVPVALITVYLVLVTVVRNVDRWRVILPFVELRSDQFDGGSLVVDATALGDTRLPAVLKTGFFAQRLLVHRDVLTYWEISAGSTDPQLQRKAKRALEGLTELHTLTMPTVEIDESEIPNTTNIGDKLVRLCRLEGARLLTSDRDLVRRANAEGVQVVDLNALANVLSPQIKPGQDIQVLVTKLGEGKGQGIGHLDDGSMVVIGGAAEQLGNLVTCSVARTHVTSNGRMIFADVVHAS